MGIVAFNWAEEDKNQLTLVMNRYNWENRVISGASWDGQILSGRSEDNKGTWFGISRQGRVAFLVNTSILLDHVDNDTGSELYPIEFLEGNMNPHEFADHVAIREVERHAEELDDDTEGWSYSLIVADMTLNSMVHIWKPVHYKSNVMIQPVPFGVHTLTPYDGLDSTEPRDLRLKGFFNEMIDEFGIDNLPPLGEIARKFMNNSEGASNHAVFLEIMAEHPILEIGNQRFGTTSTTVMAVERTGGVTLFERYRDNGAWNEHNFSFNIQ